MPILTPRRRFLITAPLALLLPAGLLTYLGLQMVSGVESRWMDMVKQRVDEIVYKIRNNSRTMLEDLVNRSFRPTLQEVLETSPLSLDTLTTPNALPFASRIFLYLEESKLNVYVPEGDRSNPPTRWRYESDPSQPFAGWLANNLQIDLINTNYGETPPPENVYPSRIISYPERSLGSDEQRELVCFIVLDPRPRDKPGVVAIGFTFDFDYINSKFFQAILDEIWNENDLRYPVSIEDRVTRQWVAKIRDLGYPKVRESTVYPPRTFSE